MQKRSEKIVAFPNEAAADHRDAIEFELVGLRRCVDGLQLANDGEHWSALRAYLVEHLQTHTNNLNTLLFPAG